MRLILIFTFFVCSFIQANDFFFRRPVENIVIPTTGKSHVEYLRQSAAYMNCLIEEYLANTKDPVNIRGKVVDFLEKYIARYNLLDNFLSEDELLKLAQSVRKLNSQDPLIIRLLSFKLDKQVNKNLPELVDYSTKIKYFAEMWIKDKGPFSKKYPNTLKWIQEAAKNDFSPRYTWRCIELTLFHDRQWKIDALKTILVREDLLDPWVAEMVKGLLEKNTAWHIRGGGFANTVKQDSWPLFQKHMKQSSKHFIKAHEMHEDYPEAAAYMVSIVGAHRIQGHTKLQWFYKAVEAEIDYGYAYSNYLWFSRPRWGGSMEGLANFGLACAKTKRYDTIVPFYLRNAAKAIIDDSKNQKDGWVKVKSLNLGQDLHEMFTAYALYKKEKNVGIFRDRNLLQTKHLSYTLHMKNYKVLHELDKLYPDQSKYNWKGIGTSLNNFDLFKSYGIAQQSSASKIIDELAEKFIKDFRETNKYYPPFTEKELNNSLRDIEDAIAINNKPGATLFLDRIREAIQLQLKLLSGEWLEINFEEDLRHFNQLAVEAKVESSKSVLLDMKSGSFLQFAHLVVDELEVECEFEHLDDYKERWSSFALTGFDADFRGRVIYHANLKKGVTGYYVPSKRKNASSLVSQKMKKVHLRGVFWPGSFKFVFNKGVFMAIGQSDLNKLEGFHFSSTTTAGTKGLFRLSNVRIRKHSIPKPEYKNVVEAYEYYKSIGEFEKNPAVFRYLARMAGGEKKNDLALEYELKFFQALPSTEGALNVAYRAKFADQFEVALDHYFKAYQIADNNILVKRSLTTYAELLEKVPDHKYAEEILGILHHKLSTDSGNEVQFSSNLDICQIFLAQGKVDKARKYFENAKSLARNKRHKKRLDKLSKAFK